MDTLIIKDLEVYANHGVFEEEKKLGQKFMISVAIGYNMKESALGNDLEKSVHYGLLSQELTKEFTKTSYDLIETCAYKLLEYIFEKYPIIKKVEVTIKKPWAPIGLPLETVQVTVARQKRRYFVSIGTNIGDKEKNIEESIELLGKSARIIKKSANYQTEAWGKTDQDDFLNCVVEAESIEEPIDFLHLLQTIENQMGRVRVEKWGSRIIDLDIIYADKEIIYEDNLIIPHPYIHERLFVLEPLNEIAPFFVHPIKNQTTEEMLRNIQIITE